ncbi:MAG TPA: plastocyanin/azurin family copper-binding protein [Solirubrobacteraceae bacterium]
MKTGIAMLLTGCALALLAGCGSSGSSTAGSTATTTARTGTSAGATATTKSSGGASIKVDTTPKFASPSPSTPVQSGTVQIAYRNIAIDPDTVRVKVGSTIRWTNYDSTQANVTSVGAGAQHIASKSFGEGKSFEVKVEKVGVIHYECTLYPTTMNGTIEVVS